MADTFKIKIEGIKELKAKFRIIDSEIQTALSKAVSAGAAVVERDAKIRVPVDTGNLRRSIKELQNKESPGRIESQVGSDVAYAPRVEFGTQFQRAQPYLRPALDENTSEIQRAFEIKLQQIIGKYK